MNLIDYNQAVEALEKERQLLLNREQYGAENVLVHHALNVIAELPIIRQPQIVRCKDCRWWHPDYKQQKGYCGQANGMTEKQPTWFCADGERREEHELETSGESRSEED